MSSESFMLPDGILKACAIKKITKRTITIVPGQEFENLYTLLRVSFI
jgi:hypothetical protein